jgi:hypothetical protein
MNGTLALLRKLMTIVATLCMLAVACVNGSAQTLTLDSFESGRYTKSLNSATTQDTHYAPLPAGSPLGQARETVFTLAPGPYGLPSSLVVEKVAGPPPVGVCIVNTGFGGVTGLQVWYGSTLSGAPAPLGLNLGGYSAFRIKFAALASSGSLTMLMEVYVGTQIYASPVQVPPGNSPFSVDFPFSSFVTSGVPDFSDIDYILIETEGGNTSFGVTSFEAVTYADPRRR